jgi:hypothetical protein
MSTTFTGTIYPSISLTSQNGDVFPESSNFPDVENYQGSFVEVTSLPTGASVDNIFYFNGSSAGNYFKRVIDGPIRAAQCGIFGTGSDMSAQLHAAANHADIQEIVFDYPGGASINIGNAQAVSIPAGKILRFEAGNMLTGTGTVSGGIIDASYEHQIFNTSFAISPEGVVSEKFSVKWFGAKGDNSTNDQPAIQKTIDTVIANQGQFKQIFFPQGNYVISSPLIAYKWTGSAYAQVCIDLVGESSFWEASGTGSIIKPNFRNTFALGVQIGKGLRIKNLQFAGLFTSPSPASDYDYYNLSFSAYTDGVSRDSLNSPYAGIAIDPFASSTPSDGGYPGLNGGGGGLNWYRGSGSGGSTGIEIEDVFITGFVVGIITSPSGLTSNAELININKLQLASCKIGVAGSQDQEKANKASFVGCWGPVHTVFGTSQYGAQTPGNWIIDTVNIAGKTIRLVDFANNSGYFPCWVTNVYAESLGEVGIGSNTYFEDCIFDFTYFSIQGYKPLVQGTMIFKNCQLRYYGQEFLPLILYGTCIYEDCIFTGIPFPGGFFVEGLLIGQTVISVFRNCSVPAGFINPNVEVNGARGTNLLETSSTYGKFTVNIDPTQTGATRYFEILNNDSSDMVTLMPGDTNLSVTVSGSHDFTFTSSRTSSFELDHLVIGADPMTSATHIMGLVTAINTGTNSVTISYINNDFANGTYNLFCSYPIYMLGAFLGDTTANTNTISNVRIDWGYTSGSDYVGKVLRCPYGSTDNYNEYIKIIDYSAGTFTLNGNVYYTGSFYFTNLKGTKTVYGSTLNYSVFSSNKILPKGTIISENKLSDVEQSWIVTKSGWINAGAASDTRQVEYQQYNKITSQSYTFAANSAIGVAVGDIVSYIVVTPSNNLTSFKIGTSTGASDIVGPVNLTAGTTYVYTPGTGAGSYFPSAGAIYFTNVATSDIIIKKV